MARPNNNAAGGQQKVNINPAEGTASTHFQEPRGTMDVSYNQKHPACKVWMDERISK
jgi:hypothetical protein